MRHNHPNSCASMKILCRFLWIAAIFSLFGCNDDAPINGNLYISNNDSISKMNVTGLDQLAVRSQKLGYYKEEVEALTEILKKLNSEPFNNKARLTMRLAQAQSRVGNYEEALNNIYEIKTTPDLPDSLRGITVDADRLTAHIYHALGFTEKALKILDNLEIKASHVINKEERDRLIHSIHLTRAGVLIQLGRHKEALDEIQKGSHTSKSSQDEWEIGENILLSSIYENLGKNEIAEECLRKNMNNSGGNQNFNRVLSQLNYAAFLFRTGRIENSIEMSEEVINTTSLHPMPLFRLKAMKLQSLGLHELGKDREAFQVLAQAFDIADSISLKERNPSIGSLEYFERRMQNHELEMAHKQAKSHRKTIYCIIIICAILIIVISFSIFRIKKKHKEVTILKNKIDDNKTQFDEKMTTSNETISSQKRQLAKLSLEMAQIQEGVLKVKQELVHKDISDKEKLHNISVLLKQVEATGNLSETFHAYFEASHEVLFSNLHRLHPDLTKGEMRMCAFILLNLSNKEIAKILYRSPRSVETAKYRLCKKLNIDGAEVYNYLQSLNQTLP